MKNWDWDSDSDSDPKAQGSNSSNSSQAKRGAKRGAKRPSNMLHPAVPPALAHVPVTYVSYGEARDYCKFYSKRLPTTWEWQYAAQGYACHAHSFYSFC